MSKKILVIPDAHAHPDYDNLRFASLGQLIVDEKPDIIVCIGDFADMPSLSSYDRGTRGFEGRRYHRDIDAAQDAMSKLLAPTLEYNEKRRKAKKRRYRPKKVMCLGNHEARIDKATQSSSELYGTISTADLGYEGHGWEVYPFMERVFIEGIAFSHYFASGVMNRPIGGEHIGNSLLSKNYMSSVQGHSHLYNHAIRTRADGQKMHGLAVGCFVHPEYTESWCAGARHLWWEGVLILDNVSEGDFSLRDITTEQLMEMYT